MPPEHCLVFEDSIAGVKAARSAGMSVIAVLGPHANTEDYGEASLILRSLLDFAPDPWNLPTFPKARNLASAVREATEVSPVELNAS